MKRIVKSIFVTSLIFCLPTAMGAETPQALSKAAPDAVAGPKTTFISNFWNLVAPHEPQTNKSSVTFFMTLNGQAPLVPYLFSSINATARTLTLFEGNVSLIITCDGNKEDYDACLREQPEKNYTHLSSIAVKFNERRKGPDQTRKEQLLCPDTIGRMQKDISDSRDVFFVVTDGRDFYHEWFLLALLAAMFETGADSARASAVSAWINPGDLPRLRPFLDKPCLYQPVVLRTETTIPEATGTKKKFLEADTTFIFNAARLYSDNPESKERLSKLRTLDLTTLTPLPALIGPRQVIVLDGHSPILRDLREAPYLCVPTKLSKMNSGDTVLSRISTSIAKHEFCVTLLFQIDNRYNLERYMRIMQNERFLATMIAGNPDAIFEHLTNFLSIIVGICKVPQEFMIHSEGRTDDQPSERDVNVTGKALAEYLQKNILMFFRLCQSLSKTTSNPYLRAQFAKLMAHPAMQTLSSCGTMGQLPDALLTQIAGPFISAVFGQTGH